MAKQSKITVKHYPNTNLKPQTENGKIKYPLYVQVIYKSTNYKFKSENDYFKYVDDTDLENDFICKMLESEIKRIERTVLLISQNNEKLLTSKDIFKCSKPLDKIIEQNLGKLIAKEFNDAPPLLTNLSYTEINSLLFFLGASAYETLQKNDKIGSVWQIIGNLNYQTFEFLENDYCYIDLFYGDKFSTIFEIIKFTTGLNEDSAKEYLENFRYFIDL
ncbi:hypothetical protein B0A58_12995 [Flavobacterium branchiophilum NBRC 15030 = ATCC 35035]|uniref:Uncharacterized protein n=1 Tax=Flavobacterium branchiophilum TaxID=55197 RepID=A0A543G3J7_9FLAO|nr:hypothetical protein [Flavobacterium branchiophilum]OXA72103.1 hypothetical protein B0A58_12995 [Flavobacterium branchiophilum NBRC 15030 = ATCC 35035]TQM40660.1 hypothetical protein BC670_1563 [Flavobacterium branchiophilum]GEM54260.1 hypothetical protein FB1_04810 [Flavobacterium branchiophilum NBRC 15030 = ATCC 35035]